MNATIGILAGDGVGPEVMAEALKVLAAVSERFDRAFVTHGVVIGGAAIDLYGVPLRPEDVEACRGMDALLLGAVGGPKWDDPTIQIRPEQGLLALRKALGLFANLRPVAVMPALAETSPVKPDVVRDVDLLVVRELTGGLYFGRPSRQWRERRGRVAVDTLVYREHEVERVARLAFDLARGRRRKVTSVDKANVIQTSRLWRSVVDEVAQTYPDVQLEHVLVDAMAMHLIRNPARFDVVLTENMFGDILTDEASVLAGSIGLLPSASVGKPRLPGDRRRFGLYEPIHGSAPDIAGRGMANPVGMISSVAMMLRTSLALEAEAAAVEDAIRGATESGIRTSDIGGKASTAEVGTAIAERVGGG